MTHCFFSLPRRLCQNISKTFLFVLLFATGLQTATAQEYAPFTARTGTGSNAEPTALPRNFPDSADKGMMRFIGPQEVMLNDKRMYLSPGTRIKDQYNRMVVAQQLTGQKFHVVYTLDTMQLVADVWLLSDYEAKKLQTPKQKREQLLREGGFDPSKKIDPLTPYDQLPKY